MQIPNTIRENAQNYAETTEQDISAEEVLEVTQSLYDGVNPALDDQSRWEMAFRKARQQITSQASLSGGNDGEMVTIITIGHGRLMQWVDKRHDDYVEGAPKDQQPKKDVLLATGVVKREESGEASRASILLDETNGVDLAYAMEVFQTPKNMVSGRFSVTDPQKASEGYVLFSTSGTELEEVDDSVPMEERQKWVDRFVDDVTIADVADNPQANLSLADTRGAADFGIDIKRIRFATIYDHYIPDDGDRGVYTVSDDSIIDPESELSATRLVGDSQRTAGLSCWTHTNLMEYDDGSIVDVYGVINEGREGQIQMDIRGIDPLDPEYIDSGSDLGSHQATSF